MSDFRQDILTYLAQEQGLDAEQLSDSTLLFSAQRLDSFSLVDVVAYVEERAKIRVRPTEVNLDNFDSIERMVSFIQAKTAQA